MAEARMTAVGPEVSRTEMIDLMGALKQSLARRSFTVTDIVPSSCALLR